MQLPAMHLDWVSLAIGFLAGVTVFALVRRRHRAITQRGRPYDASSTILSSSQISASQSSGSYSSAPARSRLGRHTLTAFVFPAILVGSLVLAVRGLVTGIGGGTVTGTITATGKDLGSWTMQVDSCRSGQRREFHGVQLFSKQDHRLGVFMVEDPLQGLTASINSTTGNYATNFGKASCSTMQGAATFNGTVYNDIRALDGSYDFDCATDTAHVIGHVTFKDCH